DDLSVNLVTTRDREMGVTTEGLWSLAEAVNAELPSGLSTASEADVQLVLTKLLDPDANTSVYQNRLSGDATLTASGLKAKSLLTLLIFNDTAFTNADLNVTDQEKE
ncbi:MAG: hypothetical protein ACC652_05950, partial [Acidimicrobiales bacterium]